MSSFLLTVMCLFSLGCRICNEYSCIAKRLSEVPQDTEQLVELIEYLKKSREVTVYKLRQEVAKAAQRLEFLMEYADLPCKSQLNTCSLELLCFSFCEQFSIYTLWTKYGLNFTFIPFV